VSAVGTMEVVEILGVSYRRLDYAVRSVAELQSQDSMTAGSGSRRRWDNATIARLFVAARLAEAGCFYENNRASSQLVPAARACMRGPLPPSRGFAILDADGHVHYRATLPGNTPVGPVGLVVRYDMGDIEAVGELLDACRRAKPPMEVVR